MPEVGRSFLFPSKTLDVYEKRTMYTINNKTYRITTKLDLPDQLYEATLSLDDGKPAEGLRFLGYGDTKEEAVRELKNRLSEVGIKERVNNYYLPWESLDPEIRRKILVYMKGVKSELLGEWMTEEERYKEWRSRVLTWTTKEYGYITSPTYGDYKRL